MIHRYIRLEAIWCRLHCAPCGLLRLLSWWLLMFASLLWGETLRPPPTSLSSGTKSTLPTDFKRSPLWHLHTKYYVPSICSISFLCGLPDPCRPAVFPSHLVFLYSSLGIGFLNRFFFRRFSILLMFVDPSPCLEHVCPSDHLVHHPSSQLPVAQASTKRARDYDGSELTRFIIRGGT